MKEARFRALTHIREVVIPEDRSVEMKEARFRALTHQHL